jgi:paraquat-inducible protein B
MVEANRIKLGLFVLTGVLLLVVLLFLLGLAEMFQPKIKYMTYFDESVQGLEIGAPVKYRGATIGKVTKVTIRFNDNIIRVDMEGLVSAIELPESKRQELVGLEDRNQARHRFFGEWLEQETHRGLRCRLELAGITGMKYVELDYFNPDDPVRIPAATPEDMIYIPSTPSLLSGLRTSVSESLSRIAAVDFQRISDELVTTLTSISRTLDDPKVGQLITRMDNIAKNLEGTSATLNTSLTEARINGVVDDLQESLRSYRELAETVQRELVAAKIAETAAATRKTADKADLAFDDTAIAARSVSTMQAQLASSLARFDEAIDALTELIRYLDQDPSSLIRGKQKPGLAPPP